MGQGVLSKISIASSTAQESVKKLLFKQLDVDTVAAVGSSDTDAILLSAGKNMVTAADGAVGVKLPVAVEGMAVTIVNTVAGEDLLVYPNTSGQINALTATTGAFTVPGGAEMTFHCDAPLHWYVGAGTTSNVYDTTTTITAFATGGQTSATALTSEFNNVTTCDTAGDSVKLPAAALGKKVTVKNSGAASLAVFPATSDSINALAINLSVNIPVGGELTFRAISGVVWETNEAFVSPAPTTQRGEFVFKASDNAADHEVILTNASHGQATTTTIPDPAGATGTVVLEEITNVFDLPQRYDANTTITAFSTGGQGSATALTGEFNNITTVAAAGDSVKLPTAAAGLKITVKNSGNNSLAVFPADADSINALAINLSVNIPVGGEMTFRAKDATVWETNEAFVSPAPTTQRGEFVFKASDNAADHEVVFTNASHGQATTITVPDSGAATSYVLQSTAAVTLVEADVLDTALAGTVVNSKAVIYDSAGKVYRSSATPAGAGTDVTNGTALTAELNYVTGADGTVGVILPIAAANETVTVVNSVTTAGNYLNVYAITGSQINALGSTVAFQLNPGQIATFIGRSATLWNTAAASDTISGLTASAAELNLTDGAVVGNSVASKLAMLDSNKRLQTNAANGTPEATVTAVHYGDGVNVTAVLTLTNTVLAVGTSENLGVGVLIYTLPTGACMIRDSYMSLAFSGVTTTTDTPEIGLGTVIATGVVTQLSGTATFENIITGQVAADTNGTATVKGVAPTANVPLEIVTAGAHTVYVNMADGWGANADQSGLLNGTVVINYTRQAA